MGQTRTLTVAALLALTLTLWPAVAGDAAPAGTAPRESASDCEYVLGFHLLYQLIPTVMGDCAGNESPAPNGDSLQPTVNGLAVYRKADNWTAFTDGYWTWINGPMGVQRRLNSERFPWEADAGAFSGASLPDAGGSTFDPSRLSLRLEPLAGGLTQPLGLTYAPGVSGRLYVVEKRGVIRVITGGQLQPVPFLDIQHLVRATESERGLLGLAFHPRYPENGYFYVNYTDLQGHTMIVRYTAPGDRASADPNSAQVLLRLEQPAANHNGGHLLFGPDGYLWIGTGDGGGAGDQFGNAQNSQALLGKMLRLDVDRAEGGRPYAIPADNPYTGTPGFRPEIWAIGLRNPWRYSFDRATSDLWIADVGQNAYEEVNHIPAGARGGLNFGWPRMEGQHCFRPSSNCDQAGLELPVTEYGRGEGISITGGFVYRGEAQPLLQGAYLFGDYGSGKLWSLHRDAGGGWVRTELADTTVNISSFGEDETGELYLTGLSDGTVYRVVAVPR